MSADEEEFPEEIKKLHDCLRKLGVSDGPELIVELANVRVIVEWLVQVFNEKGVPHSVGLASLILTATNALAFEDDATVRGRKLAGLHELLDRSLTEMLRDKEMSAFGKTATHQGQMQWKS